MFRGKEGWGEKRGGELQNPGNRLFSLTAAKPPNKGVGLDGVRRIAEYIAAEGSGMSEKSSIPRKKADRMISFHDSPFPSPFFSRSKVRIKVAKR